MLDGSSTKWQRPALRLDQCDLGGLVTRGHDGHEIQSQQLREVRLAHAVDPDDASITVVFSPTQPLQIEYRNATARGGA